MKKPNIVVILAEQHRNDCLSCANHPIVKTPNLDRLAAAGTRFSQAYTTSPVCMPARSSIQSGVYCHNHGQWSNYGELNTNLNTISKSLKGEGYRTCYVGKSHLYSAEAGSHLDTYKPFMEKLGWADILETTGPGGTYDTDSIVTDRWKALGVLNTHREDYRKRKKHSGPNATWPSPLPEGEHLDDFIGKTATEYVEKYNREEPFLLFVGFGAVHSPWDPPAKWAEQYDPKHVDAPTAHTEPPEWVPEKAALHQKTLQRKPEKLIPEAIDNLRAAYYAKTSHLDHCIGNIMDTLEKRGMTDDTLVIYLADHGEMLGDKCRTGKSVFYEESIRIPLIIRYPGNGNAGQVCDRIASIVDIFPTIVEAAGGDTSNAGFGRSLLPLLKEPTKPHHDAIFAEHRFRTMIRDERFKMVVDDTGDTLKLYDLIDDPEENINLTGKPGTEDIQKRLKNNMLNWLLSTQVRPARLRGGVTS